MKTALKIIGALLVLLIAAVIILPLAFKSKIFDMVMAEANNNLNAKVELGDLSLSLIENFPKFTITIEEIEITGKDRFEGIPLAHVGEVKASVDVMSVINGEQIGIHSVGLSNLKSHVIVTEEGIANYDILKASNTDDVEESTEETVEDSGSLNVQINEYYIRNAHVIYDDRQGDVYAELTNFAHEGKGDFTLDEFLFETRTTADAITVSLDGVDYLKEVKTDITFNFMVDLPGAKYTFKENEINLNALSLAFDGWVHMPEDRVDMDLTFGAKKTEFASILSLIPGAYTADFADVQTSGKVALEGMAKGTYSSTESNMNLPAFDLKLLVEDARFQYPDLPEAAENIQIDVRAQNPGGSEDNTVVDVNTFHVELAKNPIDFQLHLKTPVSDPDMKGAIQAQVNLESLADVVPMEQGESYSGSVTADVNFAGRLSSIEKEDYEAFSASGKLILLGMNYTSASLPYNIKLEKLYLEFAPEFVELTSFQARVGESDFSANGRIDNMLAYYFRDQPLHGIFNLNSNYVNVNEFMTESEEAIAEEGTTKGVAQNDSLPTQETTGFDVPGNISFQMNTSMAKIRYDEMDITNLNGQLVIEEETINMNQLVMNMLKGSIKMSGSYSTKNTIHPKVAFRMDMQKVDITETARNFNTVVQMAPALKSAKGAVSVKMNLTGLLDDSLYLDLETVNATGQLKTHTVQLENKTLEKLDKVLKVDKYNPLTVKDATIDFTIKDGKLETAPFTTKLGDVESTVYGYTNLDQQINYTIDSKVPFDALGGQISQLAGSLASQLQSAGFGAGNVPKDVDVSIAIVGDMSDPQVKPNFKGANGGQSIKDQIKGLAKEKVEELKGEAKAKAKEEAAKIIAEGRQQANKLVAEAKAKGDELRAEGKKAGDKIRAEADKQAKDLVKQANNPIAKIAAEKAAEEIRKKGEQGALKVEAEADTRAKQLEKEAKKKADVILAKAQEEADKKLNEQ